MKRTFFLSLFLVAAFTMYGQVTIIPKAGLTLANVNVDEDELEFEPESKLGFTLGVGFNIPISDIISFQPELSFVQKGFKTSIDESEVFGTERFEYSYTSKFSLNYLEVPVLGRITFGDATKFFIVAGPSFGYGLGGKTKDEGTFKYYSDGNLIESESESATGKIKFGDEPDGYEGDDAYIENRLDIGLQVGGGVIIAEKIMVDLRYGLGLSDLSDDETSKNRVLQFTVGIPLTLK